LVKHNIELKDRLAAAEAMIDQLKRRILDLEPPG
jgi:hypothetical protein